MGGEAALAMQGFGVGAQTVGAYYNARGQKTALSTQATVDETNASLADMSVQSAMLTGQRQEQAVRLNTAQVKSAQRAAQAANGIDLGSDSAVAVRTTTDVLGEVDAATVAANAMRTAFGYQAQAVGFRNKAIGARAGADSISPWLNAAGSLVSGAGTVSDTWYKFKKEGVFDTKKMDTDYGPQNDWFSRNFGQHNLVSSALY